MLRSSSRFAAFLAVVVIVIVGCNPGEADIGAVPTTGVVTLDGQPVDGATVAFKPLSGGKAASGITDSTGSFTLTTLESGDGAVPGSYGVSIIKMSNAGEPAAAPQSMEEAMKAGVNKGKDQGRVAQREKSQLPEKYSSAETSGLTAEVKAGGDNNFEFQLTN